jgi:hypothetical protein
MGIGLTVAIERQAAGVIFACAVRIGAVSGKKSETSTAFTPKLRVMSTADRAGALPLETPCWSDRTTHA